MRTIHSFTHRLHTEKEKEKEKETETETDTKTERESERQRNTAKTKKKKRQKKDKKKTEVCWDPRRAGSMESLEIFFLQSSLRAFTIQLLVHIA
jgi:hypothetical protein